MNSYVSSEPAMDHSKLYLLAGNNPPHIRKTFWTTAGVSLLLWTLITNAMLIISMVLALQTNDLEFIKTVCVALPVLAVIINFLDYKSILPNFLNKHRENSGRSKVSPAGFARFLPLCLMASWVISLFAL